MYDRGAFIMSFPPFFFSINLAVSMQVIPSLDSRKWPTQALGLNLLIFLTLAPYIKNNTGAGIMTTHAKANTLVAHATPNPLNMYCAKSGNPPPAKLRRNVLAAMAEFACHM